MTIGVVIPAYDAGDRIEAAIRSVLDQSVRADRIIVVDDGSTDDTPEILDALRAETATLEVIRQENAGPAAARNRALRELDSELIAFLDADDVWMPGKLEVQSRVLARHREVGIALGLTEGVELESAARQPRALHGSFGPRHILQLGSMLIRRRIFDQVGVFDESLRFNEDFDWCKRATEAGVEMRAHDDVVQRYRRHRRNMTNDAAARDRGTLRALHKSIQRRRAAREAKAADDPEGQPA